MLGCLRLVDSREVLERLFLDRTRPVDADRTLVRVQSELNGSLTQWRVQLTRESGHPDRSIRSAHRVMTQPPNIMF